MPTITYEEFRPGKWVKRVDGEVVGRATPAEVAAWKQEKAAPGRIWEDVVATASHPSSGETKVAKPPAAKAGAPEKPSTRQESDASTIWDDLVKRSKSAVQAEGAPKPRPRKEDTDRAEQAQIWQDVVKRAKKPSPRSQRRSAKQTPTLPKTAAETKSKPATKASPAQTSAAARTGPSSRATKPPSEGTTVKKTFAAQAGSPKLAEKAKSTAAAKPEQEAAPTQRAPDARLAPEPIAPAKPKVKAQSRPARRASRVPEASAAEPPPAARARASKATAKDETAAAAKVTAAKKEPAPRRRSKRSSKDTASAKPPDQIAVQEKAPAATTSQVKPKATSTVRRGSAARKRRSSQAAISRRTTQKGKPAAAQERPNQSYLWIVAGQTDDLITTVRTGLARYQQRFSQVAEVVLCHRADLPTLEGAKLPVDLREGKSLAPRNFWIGLK